jgi:hypothetical protein
MFWLYLYICSNRIFASWEPWNRVNVGNVSEHCQGTTKHRAQVQTSIMSSRNTQTTVNELIAGSFGGAAQVLTGQPMDTVKTRAQTASSELLSSSR